MTLVMLKRLADSSSESLTPCREAIAESVSPALTVYEPEAGAGAAGADVDAKLPATGAAAGAGAALPAPTLIFWPG